MSRVIAPVLPFVAAGAIALTASAQDRPDTTQRGHGRGDEPRRLSSDGGALPWHVSALTTAAAGYDSNPTFSARPEQRRAPGRHPSELRPDPSGLGVLRAKLGARTGDSWWTGTTIAFWGRQYFDGVRQLEERLTLRGGWQSSRGWTGLELQAGRYDRTDTADDAWTGRMRLHGAVRFTEWRLAAHADGGIRSYDAGGQRDLLVGGGVRAVWMPSVWFFATGSDAERRYSNEPQARRNEFAPWIGTGIELDWLTLELTYATYWRDFDRRRRDGREHVLRSRTVLRPWDAVGVMVETEYGRARGDAQALVYDRYEVLAGVQVALDWHRSGRLPADEAKADQGPAKLTKEGVRFRFRFPEASDVRVIGGFNDWQPARGRLRRQSNGWFVGTLPVEPGRHPYHLLVDGEPVAPPGADRYVEDDFGSKNAVLRVPAR